VSFKFPIALAALRKAIFNRLLPLGILFLNTLPPIILLLGASLNQLCNRGSPRIRKRVIG